MIGNGEKKIWLTVEGHEHRWLIVEIITNTWKIY